MWYWLVLCVPEEGLGHTHCQVIRLGCNDPGIVTDGDDQSTYPTPGAERERSVRETVNNYTTAQMALVTHHL